MDKNTHLASAIIKTEKESQYDRAAKKLLSNKYVLAMIMRECIEEYKESELIDIAGKYIEGSPSVSIDSVHMDEGKHSKKADQSINGMNTESVSIDEGTITYDIKFRALLPESSKSVGLIINIEAQNDWNPGYPIVKRGVYYCARMISEQYGTTFSHSEYGKLEKVYSIWICINPARNRVNTITRYFINEQNIVGKAYEPKNNYDLMNVLMVCLNGSNADNYEGILKFLDVLLSPQYEAETKKRIIEEEFHIPMTKREEMEVENMCNLSSGVKELGRIEGTVSLVIKKVVKGKTLETIAEELEEDVDTIRPIYKAVMSEKPQYNMKNIIQKIRVETSN